MALRLYSHPFASFCQKVLIALYENDTPFEALLIDLADPVDRGALVKLWPIAKFPVLQDLARGQTVPESSIIIEYLAQHYPGKTSLIPSDPDLARQTRLIDRFYDLHVSDPMQRIVADRLRPAGQEDRLGVERAKASLQIAYGMIEGWTGSRTWAASDEFGMADCSAAPALYYANLVQPIAQEYPHTRAYLERLLARPSFARVLREAEPFLGLFPKER